MGEKDRMRGTVCSLIAIIRVKVWFFRPANTSLLALYYPRQGAYVCSADKYMNSILAGFFGGWEIVLIFAVILLLFGAKKLPELAKGLGHGIREFKKATREVSDEMQNAMDDTTPPPQKKIPASTVSTDSTQGPGQKA